MNVLELLVTLTCVVGAGFANVRWLRVAQREHYLAGSVNRFARRWDIASAINMPVRMLAILALVVSPLVYATGLVVAATSIFTPVGLSVRGRTSKLVWTRRLKTLAAVTVAVQILVLIFGIVAGKPVAGAAAAAYFTPLIVDLALWLTAPLERRNAKKFVASAKKRFEQVAPRVVAVTGSYGKTSTKQYAAHLLSTTKSTFASPASFNNRGGLSKAVNEQLSPGTEVFIAEMGAYGQGEIAELCDMFPPEISVLTAIGPVHLERFGSEENIVKAKSEIFANAKVCVLNVDDARIASLIPDLIAGGKSVWRVGSATEDADVRVVDDGKRRAVSVRGKVIFEGEMPQSPPTNVACAIAVATELGTPETVIAERLATLPTSHHRQEVAVSPEGVTIIDDTFNANPASVRRVLKLLGESSDKRRVVVTPGMVELGREQAKENEEFAKEAAAVATDLVVVGKTNRVALMKGAYAGGLTPVVVERLPDAVAWVRQNIGSGDAVAYVNDLPDHFP